MPDASTESLELAIAVAKQSALTTGEPVRDIEVTQNADGVTVVSPAPAENL